MHIDLNADLGEGAGFDADLMALVTSANICCGAHAGGPDEMRDTVNLAARYGVAIGAHPGYADREQFGRRDQHLSQAELIALCRTQIESLTALADGAGVRVRYVKPHGALYNQACREPDVAEAVADAVLPWRLAVVGLPGTALTEAVTRRGLAFVAEGFADRRYRADGSLVPRTEPDAFVHDPGEAVQQVERLIRDCGIQTVCVHGDNPQAVAFTVAVRESLLAAGFELKPFA